MKVAFLSVTDVCVMELMLASFPGPSNGMRLILARDYVSHTLPTKNRHCQISSLTLKIKSTVPSIEP